MPSLQTDERNKFITLNMAPCMRAKKMPVVTALPARFGPPIPLTAEKTAPEPNAATMLQSMTIKSKLTQLLPAISSTTQRVL